MAAPRLRLASSSNNPCCRSEVRSLVAACASAPAASTIPITQVLLVIVSSKLWSECYVLLQSGLSWFCKIREFEFVAHAVNGLDPARRVGIRLDLAAQTGDMVV